MMWLLVDEVMSDMIGSWCVFVKSEQSFLETLIISYWDEKPKRKEKLNVKNNHPVSK